MVFYSKFEFKIVIFIFFTALYCCAQGCLLDELAAYRKLTSIYGVIDFHYIPVCSVTTKIPSLI